MAFFLPDVDKLDEKYDKALEDQMNRISSAICDGIEKTGIPCIVSVFIGDESNDAHILAWEAWRLFVAFMKSDESPYKNRYQVQLTSPSYLSDWNATVRIAKRLTPYKRQRTNEQQQPAAPLPPGGPPKYEEIPE